MNKEEVKKLDFINSVLALQAEELKELADELSEIFVICNCKNAESIRDKMDSVEIKLTDAYLTVYGVKMDIYNLIKKYIIVNVED